MHVMATLAALLYVWLGDIYIIYNIYAECIYMCVRFSSSTAPTALATWLCSQSAHQYYVLGSIG